MESLSVLPDAELLARMPRLVLSERSAIADVIEHLIEIDTRRLYLGEACSSLYAYCRERLGYGEDEAFIRVRLARLARRFPRALEELRSGGIHLTGLFQLSQHVTDENAESLFDQARGKTKRQIAELVVSIHPKPDLPERVSADAEQLSVDLPAGLSTRAGPGKPAPERRGSTEPLSPKRWAVQFTASSALHDKIEHARELLSHAIPGGELAQIFERALDALIERETKRRRGAGKPRKPRAWREDSRHVPVKLRRQVEERDGGQCTYVDEHGRRCSERRFVEAEHRDPWARNGPMTLDNLCLLCKAHNLESARKAFGEDFIEQRIAERRTRPPQARRKVHRALRSLGYREREARSALEAVMTHSAPNDEGELLRLALQWLGDPGRKTC